MVILIAILVFCQMIINMLCWWEEGKDGKNGMPASLGWTIVMLSGLCMNCVWLDLSGVWYPCIRHRLTVLSASIWYNQCLGVGKRFRKWAIYVLWRFSRIARVKGDGTWVGRWRITFVDYVIALWTLTNCEYDKSRHGVVRICNKAFIPFVYSKTTVSYK